MENKLTEKQKIEIYKYIFESHDHHKESANCPDSDFPYVNTKDLVRFLEIDEKECGKHISNNTQTEEGNPGDS